jgi:B12-binding domain/radical SAM domain protein
MNLVIYYHKKNRYSFNSLLGAIEIDEILKDIKIFIVEKESELFNLDEIFEKNSKTIFAFSFFTTQIFEIFDLVKRLKEKYKEKIILIAGGPHPTGDTLNVLKIGFDFVIRGEGEKSFVEFLKRLKEDSNYKDIKGVSYKDEDGFKIRDLSERVDINKYPPFSIKFEKFSPIEITRGCPFFCFYCETPFIFSSKIRHRKIENIIYYIEYMKKLNLLDIRFITPNAFSYGSIDGKSLSLDSLEKLLKEIRSVIKDKGRIFLGTFPSEIRPEYVNEETLSILKKYADNKTIVIGGQSGSEKILEISHRGHSVKDIINAVKLSIKFGFKPIVDFIFGLPGEDERDVEETIKIMSELVKMGAKIHAHSFIPLPLTPFQFERSGRVKERIRKFIKDNLKENIVFGDWGIQQKLGKLIEEYFKKGLDMLS